MSTENHQNPENHVPGLKSAPPDPDGMRRRLDAAVWRWLSGEELTAGQRRLVDMYLRPGGCHACG